MYISVPHIPESFSQCLKRRIIARPHKNTQESMHDCSENTGKRMKNTKQNSQTNWMFFSCTKANGIYAKVIWSEIACCMGVVTIIYIIQTEFSWETSPLTLHCQHNLTKKVKEDSPQAHFYSIIAANWWRTISCWLYIAMFFITIQTKTVHPKAVSIKCQM